MLEYDHLVSFFKCLGTIIYNHMNHWFSFLVLQEEQKEQSSEPTTPDTPAAVAKSQPKPATNPSPKVSPLLNVIVPYNFVLPDICDSQISCFFMYHELILNKLTIPLKLINTTV